ncbi:MAG: hypothetical protein L0G59_03475 [Kocuria sp.]|nr:hypothetical protein [Kocuria sp.]MDN5618575.1 hypothetical protein [Kocuria sp.]MDN5653695.1 hypothetical protein [Kocuria sp.]
MTGNQRHNHRGERGTRPVSPAHAAPAYILHLRGWPLTQEYPTQGSAMARDVKGAAFAWLGQEKNS